MYTLYTYGVETCKTNTHNNDGDICDEQFPRGEHNKIVRRKRKSRVHARRRANKVIKPR